MLKLVWNDLKKDAVWILIFGIVTSLIFICLFLEANYYQTIRTTSDVLRNLEKKDAWFAEGYDGVWFEDSREYQAPENDSAAMEAYLKKKFRYDSVGGFTAYVGDMMYLVGRAYELTSYAYDPGDGIRFMAKKSVLQTKGKKTRVNGETYEIGLLPEEVVKFDRLGIELVNDKIFVFCPTYEDYLKVDPDLEARKALNLDMDYLMIIPNAVLVHPEEEDVREFHRMALEGSGYYTTLQSMAQYLSQTDNKGERTHLLYVIFYIIAGIALVAAMAINLIRLMKRKFSDYAVHHLYGENYGHIYVRMNLYALGYQSLALFLFLFIMGDNALLTPWIAAGAVGLVILIGLITSFVLYRDFMENIVIYLRRKAE